MRLLLAMYGTVDGAPFSAEYADGCASGEIGVKAVEGLRCGLGVAGVESSSG